MLANTFSRSRLALRLLAAVMALALLAVAVLAVPSLVRADSTYTVKSGDNLTKIAKANNTTVAALVDANKAKYPCLATNAACLQIGWVLTIGSGGGGAPANSPSTYTVQSGDSIAKIAKKLGVNFFDLIAANKKDRPCLAAATPCALQIGWVLNVPGGVSAPVSPTTAAPAPTATSAPAASGTQAPASNDAVLAIQMCSNAEASVTIFHDGQIVAQGSIHSGALNTYTFPAGHYDVQFNGQGYANLNFSADLVAGQIWTETISCG